MKSPSRFLRLTAVSMVISSGVMSATEPPDLVALRSQYEAAMAQSAQKLTVAYMNRLLEMQKQYRAGNDSAGIAATTDALARLKVAGGAQVPGSGTNAFSTAIPGGGVGDEQYFADKSWLTAANSEFHFNKDGSGWRKDEQGVSAPFTWRRLEGGIIHASGTLTPGGAARQWYFKFDNPKTAVYGNTPGSLPTLLRVGP